MRRVKLFVFSFVLFLPCGNTAPKTEIKEVVVDVLSTEQPKNVATIFLDIDFTEAINLYDKPDGKVIATLKNNIEEENFVLFSLLQKNDSMFYVVAYHSLEENTIAKGWVFRNCHLGIYSRIYNPEVRPLILYKTPNDTLQIVAKNTEYNPDMYEVVDFEGTWLKVKIQINKNVYQGWIPPEMQCSNVYSTCS